MSKPTAYVEATSNGTKGTVRIVDRINEYTQSSSSAVKAIVDDYLKNGIQVVEVYINSAGGSVFEATEMCNDLKRLPKVTVKIGAVAASAATYFMTQFDSVASPNSQIMIHRPRLGTYGDIMTIKADLKLLENTTEDYKLAYATKMNKTVEQIEAYFAQGDYWMTANEALVEGLLNSVLTVQEEVTAESIKILEAVAAPIIPKISNENQIKMERVKLISRLKLSADATDEQIDTALQALEVKASRTEELELSAQAEQKVKAESLVDQAIASKKITANQKENYLKLASADFDGTKSVIDGLQAVVKLSNELEDDKNLSASREKWTLEDYQEKDPSALLEMMASDPKKHQRLEAEYFGS